MQNKLEIVLVVENMLVSETEEILQLRFVQYQLGWMVGFLLQEMIVY